MTFPNEDPNYVNLEIEYLTVSASGIRGTKRRNRGSQKEKEKTGGKRKKLNLFCVCVFLGEDVWGWRSKGGVPRPTGVYECLC